MQFFHRHHQNKPLLITIIIVFVLLIGAGLLNLHYRTVNKLEERIRELEKKPLDDAAITIPNQEELVTFNGETKSYTNTVYNYTLNFPANLQIKNYNDTNSTIGIIGKSGAEEFINGKVNLTIASSSTKADKNMTLEKFIFNSSKLLCDADGGGVTISCPEQKNIQPFETASGLNAYTLTLTRQESTIGPEASTISTEAVFYIIDLSTKKDRSILIINTVGDGTNELAKSIAESVRQ